MDNQNQQIIPNQAPQPVPNMAQPANDTLNEINGNENQPQKTNNKIVLAKDPITIPPPPADMTMNGQMAPIMNMMNNTNNEEVQEEPQVQSGNITF